MSTPTRKRSNKTKPFFRTTLTNSLPNVWEGLDLSKQGLRNISPDIFNHTFLKELILEGNKFREIPKEVGKLEKLEVLNASNNRIWRLPSEICKLKSLKHLDLSNNLLSSVPLEIGNLYQLEYLDLERNPLIEPFASIYKQRGGIGIITYCRENNIRYPDPFLREWLLFDLNGGEKELIKVGSYNILASRCGTTKNYPFLSTSILKPEWRFESIIAEIVNYNVDILCLQEIEVLYYSNLFCTSLEERCFYDSVFFPKQRIKGSNSAERDLIDGCAIFWKKNLFQKKDQKNLELQKLIAQNPIISVDDNIMIRNFEKDNVAIIVLLERINSDQFIVVNAHLHWNPEFSDIKFLQAYVLIKEIESFKLKYPNAGIIICGDFNSLRDSDVILFIKNRLGNVDNFKSFYSKYIHSLKIKDTHEELDLDFTHFHAEFKSVIDYIFCDDRIGIEKLLLPPNKDYFNSIMALPSVHYPSDHLFIGAEIFLKENKK